MPGAPRSDIRVEERHAQAPGGLATARGGPRNLHVVGAIPDAASDQPPATRAAASTTPGRYPPARGAVAVVTGGASGIGAALARRLAADGALVAVSDIDGDGAAAVAAGVGGRGFALDVSDAEATRSMIDEVELSLGPVEIYCSNAGLLTPGGLDTTVGDWQRNWDVHVMAHITAAQVLIPRWAQRGGGILVVTASAAGLLTQLDSASYAVTKHAAVAAAEWLAITYGDRGVQVAALCPQAVRTPLLVGHSPAPAAGPSPAVPLPAAAVDGVLEPDQVADATAEALREGRFLILPHPEVSTYAQRRAGDPDRWLAGMRRLARRLATSEAEGS